MISTGEQIGRYRIRSAIGKGGMGEVFLAEDTKLDRKVALKILPADFAEDAERMRRFVQEAKATSALNHPNIITLHEIGETDNTHFIVTEYIEGETLRDHLKQSSFSLDESLEIAIQIASALQAAHSVNIVHRDIKPENIMIRPDGLVKILDFGIAKLTEKHSTTFDEEAATAIQAQTAVGMIIGTAAYMSPEQAKGKPVDARSDIFSFGVVLYEMLTNKQPFSGESAMDIIGRILHKEPIPLNQLVPQIPTELERIINKTLCKDCKERYQTAKDLLIDLKNLQRRLDFEAELERTSAPDKEAATQIFKTDTNETTRTTAQTNSIAVLPFTNISADTENEYFCDGLAEELLNALSKIEDLKVAARTSAFTFKGKNANASEIGEKLAVKNVLEGSVRRSGNKLRISVQLVNAADGFHLWSERYDREMKDIFDVQDEIALAVVDALKLKLFGDEKAAVLKRYTNNAEAYQLYLNGRFFFLKRTPEGFKKAIDYFEKAIECDFEYALAFTGIADSYVLLGFYEVMTPAEAREYAKPAVYKAIEMDDTIAETHVSLAVYLMFCEWEFVKAEAEFEEAIRLNPNYTLARHFHAVNLVLIGSHDEAIAEESRSVEIEPFTAIFRAAYSWYSYLVRRNDLSIEQALRTIELAPDHFFAYWALGLAYALIEKYDESLSALQRASSLTGGNQHLLGEIARVSALSGKRDKAVKILNEFLRQPKESYVSAVNITKVYAGLGEREKVLEWLEKAFNERAAKLPWFMIDPCLDAFRDDERFQAILKRMGLPTSKTNQTDESLEAKTVMLRAGEATSEPPAKDSEIENAETKSTSEPATNPKSEFPKPKLKWWLFGLLGLLVLVGGFFGYKYLSPAKQIESIAVMPFINENGNVDNEYLSDGMTETLISSLSQLPNLSVKARSSVFRYKGKEIDPQQLGEELNVQAVLNGRVIQRGQDLTLYIELMDATTEKVLWSEQYNRKQTDLVSLQSEIARDVSQKLRQRLTKSEAQSVTRSYTENVEAYQLYLKGQYFRNKFTREDSQKSIEYYNQAIEKDPNYALAYTGLTASYAQMGNSYLSPNETYPKSKAYAAKALAIDETLAQAHTAMGAVKALYDWDWADAERELKRAQSLNPNYADAHLLYGYVLTATGRLDEAKAEMKRAQQLDPLSLIITAGVGDAFYYARQYDEAIEQYKKALDLDPRFFIAYWRLGAAYEQKKMYPQAIAEHQKGISNAGRHPQLIASLGHVYAVSGQREEAQKLLDELREISNQSYVNPYWIALIYVGLGEKEQAFAWLEKAYHERFFFLIWLKVEPRFDPLRDDPRFQDLLRRVGLPQ